MNPRLAAVPDTEVSMRGDRLAELLQETSPAARLTRVEAATRPVHPALAPVLPDGRLPRGAVVSVRNDVSLLLALAGGAVTRHDWLRGPAKVRAKGAMT
ncbi:hypothetical protein [Kitasatospora sp. NPDC127060]|uniref:hypothetical protein n=1 Tax=Kitasatospora sp. NPDC127060 TaxID=3347121 RepID=UPI00364AC4F4